MTALIAAIDKLTVEVQRLIVTVKERTDSFARVLWQLKIMSFAMLIFIALLSLNAVYGRYVSAQIQSATQPGGEIYERNQKATQRILLQLVEEGDCRARRMTFNLPAPDPTKSCLEQTPANVYPGGGK